MNVRLVTSLREFDALAPSWRAVLREGRQASPFLSHDWFACCWRTAGPHRQRETWVLTEGGHPLGFVPLVRWRSRRCGLPARVLGFLESPETPYIDIPHAGSPDDVVSAFLGALQDRADWDLLSLRGLPAGSGTLKAFEMALPGRFLWRVAGRDRSPYVRVAGAWEDFVRQRSRGLRHAYRSVQNRLQRRGGVSIEEHRELDPQGPIFAEVMELSRQSWRGSEGSGMVTMLGMPRFFRELTQRASANGWLHLWVLRLDGHAVATEYQIGSNGALHALRADFDPTIPDLRSGAALTLRIIEALFERREVEEYDLGPGSDPPRLRWATGAHETVWLQVYAPTPYGRFLHAVETRLIPLVRRWRARVKAACV